jgi:membrane-bound lytic murein transglycosylase B
MVGALGAIAALVAGLITGSASSHQSNAQEVQTTVAPAPTPQSLPSQPSTDRHELATELDRAQQIIDDPASSSQLLASAGQFEQLATVYLVHQRGAAQRATVALLGTQAARAMRANVAAAKTLSHLVIPRDKLPPWRVAPTAAPAKLLGYFKAAQTLFGVHWEFLAAIAFIETKFGRVRGTSTAGAQGPMQFLPSTWAEYGHGNIHDPHAAILAAARYLRANGAPSNMPDAIYHYNPSGAYVAAVQDYARVMRADPRSFYGYYNWQVLFALKRGVVILPDGFPKVRAQPLRLPR